MKFTIMTLVVLVDFVIATDSGFSKEEFQKGMRYGAVLGCDERQQKVFRSNIGAFEPWLSQDFENTDEEQYELNALIFLSCLSEQKYNTLFLRKLRRLGQKNMNRSYRIVRQLNHNRAMQKDDIMFSLIKEDDFAVLEQVAIYCQRVRDSGCMQKLNEVVAKLDKQKDSEAAQKQAKKLRKYGLTGRK